MLKRTGLVQHIRVGKPHVVDGPEIADHPSAAEETAAEHVGPAFAREPERRPRTQQDPGDHEGADQVPVKRFFHGRDIARQTYEQGDKRETKRREQEQQDPLVPVGKLHGETSGKRTAEAVFCYATRF